MLQLSVKRLGDGKLPDYHYAGDAGLDLYAAEDVTLAPGTRARVKTGIAVAIPVGYVGLIWDKSGLSTRSGVKTLAGVVDSGYRGELLIGLANISDETVVLAKHEPVAQMLIQAVEHVAVVELAELDDTERGEKGFDSRAANSAS